MNEPYLLQPRAMARRLVVDDLVARALPMMQQLVDRYDLAGRNLMSVGPGGAFEEIAMLDCGVKRAFLFDIDEHGGLPPLLSQEHDPTARNAPIVYTLDDFTKVQPEKIGMDPIGLLYFSGFTPDEARRGEILVAHTRSGATDGDPHWPPDTSPLHEVVTAAIDSALEDNGILIIQSYFHGLDPVVNPGYTSEWRDQLLKHNVHLLEGYYFATAPAITLWVGVKLTPNASSPSAERLKQIEKKLSTRSEITSFHCRADLPDKSIARFYRSEGLEPREIDTKFREPKQDREPDLNLRERLAAFRNKVVRAVMNRVGA
jgi:hypothetical protein